MIECQFEVFMDWNPVEMTRKGGDIRTVTRLVGSAQMCQVCDVAEVDDGESVRQGERFS